MTADERAFLVRAMRLLRTVVTELEVEAYMHGVRNGTPPSERGQIKPEVGSPHHMARERVLAIIDDIDPEGPR